MFCLVFRVWLCLIKKKNRYKFIPKRGVPWNPQNPLYIRYCEMQWNTWHTIDSGCLAHAPNRQCALNEWHYCSHAQHEEAGDSQTCDGERWTIANDKNADDKRPSVRRLYFSSRKCDPRPPYFQKDMESKNRINCTSSTRSRKPSWSKCCGFAQSRWNGGCSLGQQSLLTLLGP